MSKAKEKLKGNMCFVRLTDEQKNKIQLFAAGNTMTLSAAIRVLSYSALPDKIKSMTDKKVDKELDKIKSKNTWEE